MDNLNLFFGGWSELGGATIKARGACVRAENRKLNKKVEIESKDDDKGFGALRRRTGV